MTTQRLGEKGISSINTPTNDVYLVDTFTNDVHLVDTTTGGGSFDRRGPPIRIGVTDSMAGNCKRILSTMICDIPMNVDL